LRFKCLLLKKGTVKMRLSTKELELILEAVRFYWDTLLERKQEAFRFKDASDCYHVRAAEYLPIMTILDEELKKRHDIQKKDC